MAVPNAIVKQGLLNAPQAKVWAAISDYKQFAQWFGLTLEAPFVEGQPAIGQIAHPGFEHLKWQVIIKKITPTTDFSFTWHPYAIDPSKNYDVERPTLCEFELANEETGTRLTIRESGFDHVPLERREEAYRMNERGWEQQLANIAAFVES